MCELGPSIAHLARRRAPGVLFANRGWLWRGRHPDAGRAGNLSLRLLVSARQSGPTRAQQQTPYSRRLARDARADRCRADQRSPVDQLLPAIQCVQGLDPGTCRSQRRPFKVPVPWFQSIDALVSILAVPVLFWLWRLQAAHRGESGEIAKISGHCFRQGRPHPSNLADAWLRGNGRGLPLLLARIAGAGLPGRASLRQRHHDGIAFLSLFLANNIIGWLGRFYERMGLAPFWLLHAAIASTGGLFALLFVRRASETGT